MTPTDQRRTAPAMTREQVWRRRISLIGMYALGVGIGCVLVGLLLRLKPMIVGAPPTPSPASPSSPSSPAPNTPAATTAPASPTTP